MTSTLTDSKVSDTTFAEAIRIALVDAMAADDSILLLGQDVGIGFPWGVTRGIVDLYGRNRVRDTPISEAATMGCGIGAAMTGFRPVVEVDFSGFLYLGMDQLINNAAKLRYMSGGQVRIPLVVRVGQGALGSFAAQHSQSQYAMLLNVPGLASCTPSTPQEAYDLMRWGLRQDDPVVFFEDMRLYRAHGELNRDAEPIVGMPAALVHGHGTDALVVSFGYGVAMALEAAAELETEDIHIEVMALQTLFPLDLRSIRTAVERTGRVVCVGDDSLLGGISATLAATIYEQSYGSLTAPVLRVGAQHAPVPYAQILESLVIPSPATIVEAVRALVQYN